MPKIKATTPFPFAEEGIHIINYSVGEHEVNDRCAEVACKAGWAEMVEPESVQNEDKEINLAALKRDELVAIAVKHNIEIAASETKAQIIERLTASPK